MRLKNAHNLRTCREHTEAEEKRRTFIWILHKIMEITFSRLMFISATSPLVLCMYKFVFNQFYLLLNIRFLPARETANFLLAVGF